MDQSFTEERSAPDCLGESEPREASAPDQHRRALAWRLTLAEQRARHRFAAELHDELAQVLAVCRMKLGQVARCPLPEPGPQLVGEVESLLEASLERARALVAHLDPTVLYEGGLAGALQWLARQMERHQLEVVVQTHEPLPALSAERATVLVEAVRELLLNISQHAGVHRATMHLAATSDHVQVTVADDGIGFDAGSWHDNPLEAPGHGLFHVHQSLEAAGGWAQVTASPGEGTQVLLTVPLPPEPRPRAADSTAPDTAHQPAAAHRPPPARPRIHVLLVDDHAIVRQGLRSVLEQEPDIDIVGEASRGEEAIALAQQLKPDVTVLDVSMPGMSGIETTRRIRQCCPHVRVIGLSVHDDLSLVSAMKNAGATAYLAKGGSVDELCQTIRDAAQSETTTTEH